MSGGGYRETESGLDASILRSHDKSGKDREVGGNIRRKEHAKPKEGKKEKKS